MSQQLVCPLCSESLDEEGAHFYKHFKYKRYTCGTNRCDLQFYTEADRETHCTEHGHKRSFQKTVNPYIDKMIEMVVHDARELASKSIDTVVENRFGGDSGSRNSPRIIARIRLTSSSGASPLPSTSSTVSTVPPVAPPAAPKKRPTAPSATTPTASATKKTRTSGAPTTSSRGGRRISATSPLRDASGASMSDVARTPAPQRARTTSDNQVPPPTLTPSSSAIRQIAPSSSSSRPAPPVVMSSPEVDSTTPDIASVVVVNKKTSEKPPARKKPSESSNGGDGSDNVPLESLSATDDANTIECELCKKKNKKERICYDFLVRYDHVTKEHMTGDVDKADYEEIAKAAMDECFPEVPNSKRQCQLCSMDGKDISKSARRHHIENYHSYNFGDYQTIKCPFSCEGAEFKINSSLTKHMNEVHKIVPSAYKDNDFKLRRQKRNGIVEAFIKKCFPWSQIDKNEHNKSTDPTSISSIPSALRNDIRLKEANKTRRAPQQTESSDSDSDDEEDKETEDDGTTSSSNRRSATLQDEDVQIISQKFNADVARRLRENAMSRTIKEEVVDASEVEPQPPTEKEKSPKLKEEAPDATVEENPTRLSTATTTSYANPLIISSYAPIVPPPSAQSPDPIVPSLFALHSGWKSPENGSSTEQPFKQSPPSSQSSPSRRANSYRPQDNGRSSSRPRIQYTEHRGAGSSWSGGGGGAHRAHYGGYQRPTSSSYPYNQGNNRGNNTVSRSSYGSTAFRPNDGPSSSSRHRNEDSYQSTSTSSTSYRSSGYNGQRSNRDNNDYHQSNRFSRH